MLKTVLRILVSMMLFMLILEFIPIKLGINADDAKKNTLLFFDGKGNLGMTAVFSEGEKEFDVKWDGKTLPGFLSYKDFSPIDLENGHNIIPSEDDDANYFAVELYNDAVLRKTNVDFSDIKITKWRICAPVRRLSVRALWAPKHYLSIYDFKFGYIASIIISLLISILLVIKGRFLTFGNKHF